MPAWPFYFLTLKIVTRGGWPLLADSVAKVENRSAPKISRKSILEAAIAAKLSTADTRTGGILLRNDVLPHVAPRETHQRSFKFRSSPEKDFFNIGAKRTSTKTV
jgi:hypothetical protein